MLQYKRITASKSRGLSIDQVAEEFFKSLDAGQLIHIECLTETNSGNLRGIVVLYEDMREMDCLFPEHEARRDNCV